MTPIPTNTTAPPLQSPSSEHPPEIDEDGYCIQPKDPLWNTQWPKKGSFFVPIMFFSNKINTISLQPFHFLFEADSDSDSDSDNDERERKIHVEIKPLNNGSAPISASVDELRATVENLSLSPLGGALSV